MPNIDRRRDDAMGPPAPQSGPPPQAERFVRAMEQIAIDARQRDAAHPPQPAPAQPTGAQPAAPGAPPTVIYINNTTGPGQVGAAPGGPTPEVHYHTTVQQSPRGTMTPRYQRKGTSAFGAASVMLGVVACVAVWTPGYETTAFPVAALGAGLGALGWLLAVLLGRTGASLPFAGIFISLIALGLSVVGKEATQPYLDELKSKAETVIEEGKKHLPKTSEGVEGASGVK